MNIPAMDEPPEGPWDDAELILFSADAEWAEEEPQHDTLEELGIVSFSLWARWEDDGVEIPILGEASWHYWYSINVGSYSPDAGERVSDGFIQSIVEAVDEDVGGDWGAVTDETWAKTSDLEKYIAHLTLEAFVQAKNDEPALIIDWCQKQAQEATDE